jgi:hypothetical protein
MQPNRRPDFWRLVLREAPVLVPAGVIFAVIQGGQLVDWLIAAAAVVVIGVGMGWLIYQREKIKQRPMPPRSAAKSARRRR